jgi:hypothetical protein
LQHANNGYLTAIPNYVNEWSLPENVRNAITTLNNIGAEIFEVHQELISEGKSKLFK